MKTIAFNIMAMIAGAVGSLCVLMLGQLVGHAVFGGGQSDLVFFVAKALGALAGGALIGLIAASRPLLLAIVFGLTWALLEAWLLVQAADHHEHALDVIGIFATLLYVAMAWFGCRLLRRRRPTAA